MVRRPAKGRVKAESVQLLNLQSAILSNAAYAIIATAPSGTITQFNPAAERMLGYTAEEMVGRQTPEILHLPEELSAAGKMFSQELNQVVEPGFDVFVADARHGPPREREWTYVRKDGGRLPVLLSVTTLWDEAGRISGYVGIASDISERKRAEARLRASEEKIRKLFEFAPLGIAMTTMDGQYIEFNEAFRQICGYTTEELHALDYWELTPPEYQADEDRQIQSLRETGRYGPYEKEYIRKDGTLIPIRLNGALITGSDGEQYIWSIVEDISAHRLHEAALIEARMRAEAASQAKSNFLATMSHEIRTPLNGVLGMVQVMERDALNVVQRERLDVVRRSGEALLTILSDVLDLAKIEAGRLDLEAVDFDLADLLGGAAANFATLAAAKGLALESDLAGLCGTFNGDPTRIRQIVSNLLSNAVKFTEAGAVRLSARHVDGRLDLAVSDTGPGIAPDALPRLFERFVQADSSATRRFGGTGLGLAISRELAELMGGSIRVDSRLGEGSRFALTLPLRRVSEAARPDRAAPAPARESTRLRILAAEDNQVNQKVLQTVLEQAGQAVTLVADGAQAVAAFREATWDLILMDVQMPVMDGVDATRAIRDLERASGRARTPIIALTANAMEHQKAEYLACGMDGLVAKPIRLGDLFAAIDSVAGAPDASASEPTMAI
jgi:PAS domain S-box-containing protein